MLVSGGLFVWGCSHFDLAWYWYIFVVLCCLLMAGAASKQAVIDCSQRVVFEHHRLFMRICLWTRAISFSDFKAVIYSQCGEYEVYVGLRHRSGCKIWIRNFRPVGCRPGRDAQEFAWRLTCDTDIEIDERTRHPAIKDSSL
jgi:hypothetical protein